jgi:hypothetical protein
MSFKTVSYDSGKEVWRRDGDKETFVTRGGADIPDSCGPVHFIFDAGGGRLGIALE